MFREDPEKVLSWRAVCLALVQFSAAAAIVLMTLGSSLESSHKALLCAAVVWCICNYRPVVNRKKKDREPFRVRTEGEVRIETKDVP